MAALNPHLFELIETLLAARLDWLASELIEGVQVGRLQEEQEEALTEVREAIRTDVQPKMHDTPSLLTIEARPIPPDEQIDWAIAYVVKRLGEALWQLSASLDALDAVAGGGIERQEGPAEVPEPFEKSKPKAAMVLLGSELDRKVNDDDIAAALESLPFLRSALNTWAAELRDEGAAR